jgi:hypothetical protein
MTAKGQSDLAAPMDNKRIMLVACGVFCVVVVANKIRRGGRGKGALEVRKSEAPGRFWALVIFDLNISLFLLLYALFAKHIP